MTQAIQQLKNKRPVLVWITQALVVIFVLLQLLALTRASLLMPQVLASAVPWWKIALSFAFTAATIALLVALFLGLAKAHRWAWYGGIAFSVLLLVFTLYSRAHPTNDAIPIPSNQLLGAAIGELLITFLLFLYPFRMYFSKSVRAFFSRP